MPRPPKLSSSPSVFQSHGKSVKSRRPSQLLYVVLPHPLPAHSEHQRDPLQLIIWAGSTSVGLFAIALAKLLDPSVPIITSASPHNFDLIKARGADVVFDYKDPEVSAKIAHWAEENGYGAIERALDCVSEGGESSVS